MRLFLLLLCFLNWLAAMAQSVRTEQKTVPGSAVNFELALIPGGQFIMGSSENEPGRADDEGRHQVYVDSFWIGIREVTFDELFLFQFRNLDSDASNEHASGFKADAVARPSPPYYDFTYGRGKAGGFPATTMTQQCALRYCQWLSDKTGEFYRLPTEAEWEYACRAGTQTVYSWGDDPKMASEFAWFYDNSAGSYQKTGLKKPNPWGLYDMHGNVAEYCLDFYVPDYFARLDSNSNNPLILPIKKHSRTVRGGCFEDYPEAIRSADRRKSDPKWQARDPQIPKSKWWNPESPFVGFRLVRELKKYSKAERDAFFEKVIKD
ncbi:MAG: formylglycine-generating enzyme family protein [Saprospiraceae bacterium]|nr:formylglycine-generating enzyme family protein [Saprospiraceae bacterium]